MDHQTDAHYQESNYADIPRSMMDNYPLND